MDRIRSVVLAARNRIDLQRDINRFLCTNDGKIEFLQATHSYSEVSGEIVIIFYKEIFVNPEE